jgi:thioredoxin-related protein
MEKISINAEPFLVLESKNEWVRKVPDYLPKKQFAAETWICIDKNGDQLAIGEDFTAAETKASYPVTFYRLQRVANTLKKMEL